MFGALLVAIVGMRVEVLKLSSRVGTQIGQVSALQSSNAALRSTVSELSGNERIEALAAKDLDMVMPGPMDIHFVPGSDGTHLAAAIRGIHAPNPDSFLTGLAAERLADETSLQNAAQTSAVGVLANSVTTYTAAAGGGVTANPLSSGVGSTSAAPAGQGASSSSGGGPGTAAATVATSDSGAGTASSSGAGGAGSTATASGTMAGTVAPGQAGVTADVPAAGSGATSANGSGATSPPSSDATSPSSGSASATASGSASGTAGGSSSGTVPGNPSESASGGTSLNG